MSVVVYYEQYIYTGVYYSLLAIMPLLEFILPLRANKHPLMMRWVVNFLLGLSAALIHKLLFPILGLALAVYVHQQGWGLFNLLNTPDIVAIFLCVFILDFVKYTVHRLMHYFPAFWAFHKIHHSDPDYDFTTSFRFHPLEVMLTSAVGLLVILVFGVPLFSVIIVELLVVCVDFFSHTNLRLPATLEKIIRCVFVTPYMHRIHHSADESRTNSNYSIIFPYWDYLGKTYTPVTSVDQKNMTVGLLDCTGKKYLNIFWLLVLPFVSEKKEYTES